MSSRDCQDLGLRGRPLRAQKAALRSVLHGLAEEHGVSVHEVREALVLHALGGDVDRAIEEWKAAHRRGELPGLFVTIEIEEGSVLEMEPETAPFTWGGGSTGP